MYKEFLSDEEITYLVGLTKKKNNNTKNEDGDHGKVGTNDTSDGSGLIRQIRAGAADGQAAMQRAQTTTHVSPGTNATLNSWGILVAQDWAELTRFLAGPSSGPIALSPGG